MLVSLFAAAAASVTTVAAQAVATPPARDFSTATAMAGSWTFQTLPGASEARFVDTGGIAAGHPLHQGFAAGEFFTNPRGRGGKYFCLDQFREPQCAGSLRSQCDARDGRFQCLRPSAGRDRLQPRPGCSDDCGRLGAGGSGVARSSTNNRGLPNLNRNTSLAL